MTNSSVVHVPLESKSWPRQREWTPLASICDGVFDCPHSTPKLTSDGPFVVRSQDVRSGVFRLEEAGRVSEKTYGYRIERAEPRHGDLFYSREGTYFGIAAEVPSGVRVCLGQRMVLIRPKPDVINHRFLRLWLNSPTLSRHIHGFRDGTVAERLNMPTIRGLPVPVFQRQEQESIAELLGSLDDKIELNRRMNEALEAMAQAIFRDWFVDFGPTRRKMEGATDPVGMMGRLVTDAEQAQALAALFPVKLGDDGLPEGWERHPLLDEAQLISGGTPKTDRPDYWDGGVAWASAKDVSQCGETYLLQTERNISEAGLSNSSTKLVPQYATIVVARGATTGRLCMLGDTMAMNQTCYALSSRTHQPFLLNNMFKALIDSLVQAAHGSVFDTITTKTLATASVLKLGDVSNAYEAFVAPFYKVIENNTRQTTTLAATRSLLLPKLISGEIRLCDAEDLLEAAQ